MQKTLLSLSIVALAMPAFAQFAIVAPNGYAAVEGASNNAFPWNRATASMHFLQIYDSSHFTNQGITNPILISTMKFRANGSVATWAGGSWPNIVINMSTAAVDYLAANATFASNHGGDLTNVLTGPVTVAGGTGTGTTVPGPLYVTIPLSAPFLYDPTSGNDLAFEVQLDGLGWTGVSTQTDAISGAAAVLGPPLGSRVYFAGVQTNPTGTVGLHHMLTTEFTYLPPAGLYPNFSGTPRTGPVGQNVAFTDQTYTNDPGGVTSYAWDVDGDLITDYTTQNCAHTYTTEGSKNVSLTVTSAMFGTQSLTKNGFIVVDAVDASFTSLILPGSLVVFTDTSTGGPTTWAWDYTNDGIVDSTAQNTANVYPGPGQYTCRLTVTDAFSNDTTTTTFGIGIIPIPPFGSTFSGAAATRGFWFQAPTRFSIITARVPDEFLDGTQNVALYRLAAAPPGFPTLATGGLEFVSVGQPSANNIPCVVSYDTGEFVGVLGACGTTTMRNSYGTPAGPFASSVLGVPTTLTRMGTQFNLLTTMGTTGYWQEVAGAISRVVLGVTACAAIPYGAGTPSGAGPVAPRMRATALPFIGQTAVLSVEQGDSNALMFMVAGFGRAATPSPWGTILINPLVSEIMNGAAIVGPGTYTHSFTIPNDPTLVGISINWQNANLVVTSSQVSLSNGVEFWLDV